jgi:hypothetical protein
LSNIIPKPARTNKNNMGRAGFELEKLVLVKHYP